MNRKIEREKYLAHARGFTAKELALIKEFGAWLPKEIIDCHAHCNLEGHVCQIEDRGYNHMFSTFPSFSVEESSEWNGLLHPDTKIRTLRFPNAYRGINHREANSYLLSQNPKEDRVALYGIPDDTEYTIGMLKHPRVSGLKMYYAYFEPPAKEIYQYFPKTILEVAQDMDIPIILHPPSRITTCLDQILRLIEDFPHLRVCLAHLSLTKYVVSGLEEAFTVLSGCPQISFDTALVPSSEVVEMAMRIIGSERIMYGSDAPLDLIRSVAYKHPRLGERIVTEYPYHWMNLEEHAEFKSLAGETPHSHWQSLLAVKEAISSFPETERELMKQKIFYSNAKLFYGF